VNPAHSAVTVRKLKFDGTEKYRWPGDLLGVEGEWLIVHHDRRRHAKVGAQSRPEADKAAHFVRYAGQTSPLCILFAFDARGAFLDAKCDAALPATFSDGVIDFVDMDLDVIVLPGSEHYVRDQEEFARRTDSMGYTPEATRLAHLGILHALRMVRRRQFPFDGHAESLGHGVAGGTTRLN
jgi:hypothetical protein